MNDDGERRKSALVTFLEIGQGFLQIGWRSLEFLTTTAERLLPDSHSPEPLAKSGRGEDRETEPATEMRRRERLGTVLVVASFIIAMLGGFGFLVAYWSGGNNTQRLGGSLAPVPRRDGVRVGALGALTHEPQGSGGAQTFPRSHSTCREGRSQGLLRWRA